MLKRGVQMMVSLHQGLMTVGNGYGRDGKSGGGVVVLVVLVVLVVVVVIVVMILVIMVGVVVISRWR